MDSKPLRQALQLLQQDGRFDIRYLNNHKVAINGVVLDLTNLTCKDVDKCMERILDKYKYAAEMPLEVLPVDDSDVEELLKQYPELEVFGVEWVKKWGRLKDRLVEIAEALRRYPWMMETIKKRPVDNPHPYLVEVYVALDESEVCLLLNRSKAFCNGKETSLVLRFAEYRVFDERIREIYRCGPQKYTKIL
jgi:hypothetical protein